MAIKRGGGIICTARHPCVMLCGCSLCWCSCFHFPPAFDYDSRRTHKQRGEQGAKPGNFPRGYAATAACQWACHIRRQLLRIGHVRHLCGVSCTFCARCAVILCQRTFFVGLVRPYRACGRCHGL